MEILLPKQVTIQTYQLHHVLVFFSCFLRFEEPPFVPRLIFLLPFGVAIASLLPAFDSFLRSSQTIAPWPIVRLPPISEATEKTMTSKNDKLGMN